MRYASDVLILAGALCTLAGVYLLLGVAVALSVMGLALLTTGLMAGWKAGI